MAEKLVAARELLGEVGSLVTRGVPDAELVEPSGVTHYVFVPPVPGAQLVFRYPVLCWKISNTGEFRLTA